MSLVALLTAAALATEPPLALPASPGASVPEARPAAPTVAPVGTLGDLLAAYRNKRLQLRGQRSWSGGGTTYVSTYRSWTPFWGVGTTYAIQDPLIEHHTWSVYQGPTRLTVPTYLGLIGNQEALEDTKRRIDANRRASVGLAALGVVGSVITVVGLIGSANARTESTYYGYAAVAGGGALSTLGGFGGSFFTGNRSRALRYDFTDSLDLPEIDAEVDAYNARLRASLGLSPHQTASIDAERTP